MSEEEKGGGVPDNFGFSDGLARREMERLFEKMSFFERMKRTANGLGKPHDSGEYKFAKLQVQRMSGPFFAVLIPLVFVIFLLTLEQDMSTAKHNVAVEIIEQTEIELEEEPPPPPEQVEFEPIDTEFDGPVSDFAPMEVSEASLSNEPLSPKPAEMNAVAIIKSPIIMRGILGSRNSGARGQALKAYGGSQAGEATVLRALRWLKMKQNPDGSWPGQKVAMTGLAVLTYLAHGETPRSECVEFGPTVEKGIRYLADNVKADGFFTNKDGNNYAHLIGTYALCEAYSLTRVPKVKEAAERALAHIIKGQHPDGTWDYNMKQTERHDTSYMAWASQAIKAAQMAGDLEVEGLEECYKMASEGFKVNANYDYGGFGYTDRHSTGLSGAGTLCMQLLGQANSKEVKNALNYLSGCTYSFDDWENQPYKGGSPVYYWYYITQAKFHAGGSTWTSWNKQFSPELQKQQKIMEKAIADPDGIMQDVGWWESPSESEHHAGGEDAGRVQDTCLCALQLMVYYRYLPTFKTPEAVDSDVMDSDDDENEVGITIRRG